MENNQLLNPLSVRKMIEQWLQEDIGNGDITTDSIVPASATTTALIHAKASGVIAGIWLVKMVFECLSPAMKFTSYVDDGEYLASGQQIALIEGNARAILTGERLALNIIQRLSGIATMTQRFVQAVKDYQVKIVDTRKTAPGLRMLDKYAVRAGGGSNHRYGLYDAVLIKDNHIKVAGSIDKAVALAGKSIPHTVKIEVETENLSDVQAALAARADIIMLDNMDFATMREAVSLIDGRALVEASGGVDETTVVDIARAGVDIISIGSITHSVKALDISLDIGEIKISTR